METVVVVRSRWREQCVYRHLGCLCGLVASYGVFCCTLIQSSYRAEHQYAYHYVATVDIETGHTATDPVCLIWPRFRLRQRRVDL